MSSTTTPPKPQTKLRELRIRVACSDELKPQVEWVLEHVMWQHKIPHWRLVNKNCDTADLTIRHDETAWQFEAIGEASPSSAPLPPGALMPPSEERDPLAAIFWHLARVEEKLAAKDAFDEYGRFKYASSYSARSGSALNTPVDDLVKQLISDDYQKQFGEQDKHAWQIVATHDIDLPWRWTKRGTKRALRAAFVALKTRDYAAFVSSVWAFAALPIYKLTGRDPWSNAARIKRLEKRQKAESTSYIIAQATTAHDGEERMHSRGRARYLKPLDAASVGVHGSFITGNDPAQLTNERLILEAELQKLGRHARITDHRYHYLKHEPVRDWPHLARAGFLSDSSLGWAEQPGFRAGTTHPYRAWDHENNRPLDLVIIPLVFMDASLDQRYLNLPPHKAGKQLAETIIDQVKQNRGCASILFHNDRLATLSARRWHRLYRHLLKRIRKTGGEVITAKTAADTYLTFVNQRNEKDAQNVAF